MVRTEHSFRRGAGPARLLQKLAAVGVGLAATRSALAAVDAPRTLSCPHPYRRATDRGYYADGGYCSAVLQGQRAAARFSDDTVYPIDRRSWTGFLLQPVGGPNLPVISGYRSRPPTPPCANSTAWRNTACIGRSRHRRAIGRGATATWPVSRSSSRAEVWVFIGCRISYRQWPRAPLGRPAQA
jgi:hypothetical protein